MTSRVRLVNGSRGSAATGRTSMGVQSDPEGLVLYNEPFKNTNDIIGTWGRGWFLAPLAAPSWGRRGTGERDRIMRGR